MDLLLTLWHDFTKMKKIKVCKTKSHEVNRQAAVFTLVGWFDKYSRYKIITGIRRCGKSKLLDALKTHISNISVQCCLIF